MDISDAVFEIKKSGLRMTPTRIHMVELLCRAKDPLAASDFLKHIDVNKTTIYRDLELLKQYGVLTQVDLGDGNKRYELSSMDHHHHLICVRCKSVDDVTIHDDFATEEKHIARIKQFTVLKHNLEFFGVCANCQ